MAFVAELDGIVRGFVYATAPRCVTLRPPPDSAWELEIAYLYVDPRAQRLGLGRTMLRQVAGEAKRVGLRRCVVIAFAGNPSRHAYEQLGALPVRTERFELEGWTGEDVYYEWKDIAAAFGV